MTKLSKYQLNHKHFAHYINNLWSAFTLMDSKQEIKLLFKDLFTRTEYQMFAKRFEIARCLLDGQTYQEIQRGLHVTSHTIYAVSNALAKHGDGFRKAHTKLGKLEIKIRQAENRRREDMANPFRQKARRGKALGILVGAGLKEVDKIITKSLRRRSAKSKLSS